MRRLWPVDWVIGSYLIATGAVVAIAWARIPQAPELLAAHIVGLAAIAAYAWIPTLPGAHVFRHWYPLPWVAACYREMSILIAALRGASYDVELAALDRTIWGVQPTLALERYLLPPLTEFLQIAYSLFVPTVLAVAAVLWFRGQFARFRSYALLIALGFLVSYVGYYIVPARGPRILFAAEYTQPLAGWLLAGPLRQLLDVLESAHYDCFPSGHMEMTLLAWWGSRQISARLGYVYAAYSCVIAFSTVYLRYHYTVDLAAGAIAAALVIWAVPRLERMVSCNYAS